MARAKAAVPRVIPNSLVGSAIRLSGKGAVKMPKRWSGADDAQGWMNEAWRFYETVGELRFAANWVGNSLSRVRLYAAQVQPLGMEPAPVDDGPGVDAVAMLAGGPEGQAEMLRRLGVILSVPGAGYVLGEPQDEAGDLLNARWYVTSGNELSRSSSSNPDGTPRYAIDAGTGKRDLHPDTLVTRVWRAHPRKWWEADSPTRGALPVLAELEMLTQHVLASAQSRLAGAGILILPQELSFPSADAANNPELAATDPFLTDLTEVMVTAIGDRTSPAAVVPIVLRVPGEYIDKIQHLKLEFPLDEHAKDLRDEAIRRLAAAMDMPSEIVLGLGDTNHWSAWQMSEQAVTVHITPLATLICDALTQHFLVPTLESMGVDPEGQVIWFDTTALTQRPNQAEDAKDLFDRNAIGLEALRRATGFAQDDAPEGEEITRQILLKIIAGAPSLAPCLLPSLGIEVPEGCLPNTGDQTSQDTGIKALPGKEPEEDQPPKALPKGPPPTKELPPPTGGPEQGVTAALVASCDGLVFRALERAGSRLRTLRSKDKVAMAMVAGLSPATIHQALPVTPAEVGDLLAGAWDRVPEVAARYGLGPGRATVLALTLDTFTRQLLLSALPYSVELLEQVLATPANA